MPCAHARRAAQRRAHVEANRVDVNRFAGIEDPVEILKLIHVVPPHDELVNNVPYSRPHWEVYAELDQAGVDALTRFALNEASADTAYAIASSLATFTDRDLSELQRGFLDRGDAWPSHLFRGAGAAERDRLLVAAEEDSRISRNHALVALAWIGDDRVGERFAAWRANPPGWVAELHVPPEAYACYGGWELGADGERRALSYSPCWSLVQATGEDRSGVRAILPQDAACGWCGRRLTALLDIDFKDERLAGWSAAGDRVVVGTCLRCGCYGTPFVRCDAAGVLSWANENSPPDYLPGDDDEGWQLPTDELVLAAEPRAPWWATDWMMAIPCSQVGGMPSWIQDAAYPACPDCKRTMQFVGQVAVEDLAEYGEGIYYAHFCLDCRIGTSVYQQT